MCRLPFTTHGRADAGGSIDFVSSQDLATPVRALRIQLQFQCSLRLSGDGRPGGAIEAQVRQGGKLFCTLHSLGDDRQADIVRDAAQSLEEGLVARLGVDGADEAAVDLQVVQADAVQAADFAELAAEMFDAEAAAERAHGVAEGMEGVEMLEGADFRDFQPEAGGQLAVGRDQGQQVAPEDLAEDGLAG